MTLLLSFERCFEIDIWIIIIQILTIGRYMRNLEVSDTRECLKVLGISLNDIVFLRRSFCLMFDRDMNEFVLVDDFVFLSDSVILLLFL